TLQLLVTTVTAPSRLMGLDLLDIRFRVERSFGIKISDDEFLGMVRDNDITVGDLYTFILQRLNFRDVGRFDLAINRRLWTELQEVLSLVIGEPCGKIELGSRLDSLFPRETRRAQWDDLREALPYHIRELEYPRVIPVVGFLLAAGVVAIEQFHLWQLPWFRWLWPLFGLFGLWMLAEAYFKIMNVFAPFRTRFPARVKTVKDLCRTVLANNYAEICRGSVVHLDDRSLEIWQTLVEQLSHAVGVETDHVTFHSRLIRDLGME
ncbi:MAG: acyl carrier protein, partial [Pirellulales bacterium]|nr:acyl carrier protein [Pirellulales bacterium]